MRIIIIRAAYILCTNNYNIIILSFSSESLYAGGISGKYSATPPPPRSSSSSQPSPDTYKFSTFGYHAPCDASVTTLPYPMYATMQQPTHTTHLPSSRGDSRCDSVTHTIDITPTSTVIDNYEYRNNGNGDLVLQSLPTPPPPSSIHMRNFNSVPRKMEESCIMLEIRNSAPDVIIMTSH